jgi:hypothetical protein
MPGGAGRCGDRGPTDIGEAVGVRAQREVHEPRRDIGFGQCVAQETRGLVFAVERGENAD